VNSKEPYKFQGNFKAQLQGLPNVNKDNPCIDVISDGLTKLVKTGQVKIGIRNGQPTFELTPETKADYYKELNRRNKKI
jgi:hypothetical protein